MFRNRVKNLQHYIPLDRVISLANYITIYCAKCSQKTSKIRTGKTYSMCQKCTKIFSENVLISDEHVQKINQRINPTSQTQKRLTTFLLSNPADYIPVNIYSENIYPLSGNFLVYNRYDRNFCVVNRVHIDRDGKFLDKDDYFNGKRLLKINMNKYREITQENIGEFCIALFSALCKFSNNIHMKFSR